MPSWMVARFVRRRRVWALRSVVNLNLNSILLFKHNNQLQYHWQSLDVLIHLNVSRDDEPFSLTCLKASFIQTALDFPSDFTQHATALLRSKFTDHLPCLQVPPQAGPK